MKRKKVSPFDVSLGPLIVVCSYLRPAKDRHLLPVSKVFGKSFLLSSREQMLIYDKGCVNFDFVYWFLDKGGEVDDPTKLLLTACENDKSEIVRLLLVRPEVDPSAQNNEAIIWASRNGHTEVVRLLLAHPKVDLSADDNEAIRLASYYGHTTEVVRLLLADPKVDPSDWDNYAIGQASYYGYIEVVRLLLAHPRVDPSVQDNFAIRYASKYDHTEIVKLLEIYIKKK
jgi:hypothetical protein